MTEISRLNAGKHPLQAGGANDQAGMCLRLEADARTVKHDFIICGF
jgi:hypothetical protein